MQFSSRPVIVSMQSRRDRDKYIKVVKANIAPGAAENFQKIDIENITSLGYPYDFDSVMHYDALAFTKNGAPTMKVRKEYRDIPSTELGMKDRLSDLDIAQVNAMYECNQKKPLSEGWYFRYLVGINVPNVEPNLSPNTIWIIGRHIRIDKEGFH